MATSTVKFTPGLVGGVGDDEAVAGVVGRPALVGHLEAVDRCAAAGAAAARARLGGGRSAARRVVGGGRLLLGRGRGRGLVVVIAAGQHHDQQDDERHRHGADRDVERRLVLARPGRLGAGRGAVGPRGAGREPAARTARGREAAARRTGRVAAGRRHGRTRGRPGRRGHLARRCPRPGVAGHLGPRRRIPLVVRGLPPVGPLGGVAHRVVVPRHSPPLSSQLRSGERPSCRPGRNSR